MLFSLPIFVAAACNEQKGNGPINWSHVPSSNSATLELCTGIRDKMQLPGLAIKERVLEKCGYDVPLEKFEFVQKQWYDRHIHL